MTSSEIDRIMAAVEAVRAEVRGLRVDFNGRVRSLELWKAKWEGRVEGASGVRHGLLALAGLGLTAAGIAVGAAVALLA